MKAFMILVLGVPLWAQSNLTVKTATSKHVDLSWSGSASSYTVQRAVLGASFSTIATVSTTSYSDTTIDAYTTYRYQISASSATSNPVTVGPPPAGLSAAAPAPLLGSSPSQSYGYNVAMTLDGNGDPAFVFIWDDPKNSSDRTINPLLFRSWNRAQYNWNPIVTIGTVGDVTTYQPITALGYDAATNTFLAASLTASTNPDFGNPIKLYVSTDGGATWTLKTTLNNSSSSAAHGISMVLSNGNIYLVYTVDYQGLTYMTGKISAAPSTWTSKPDPGGQTNHTLVGTTPSIALDGNGNPAIAYFIDDPNGPAEYNPTLFFWRPAGAPVKVVDNAGHGQDDSAVRLLFHGTNPRILLWVDRGDGLPGEEDSNGVHFAHSEDGGTTWKTVLVPPDGNASTDFPFDLALDSQGNAVAAFGQNGSYGDDSHHCPGGPRLSFSPDLTNFTVCPPANPAIKAMAASTSTFGPYPAAIQAVYGGNDKLYLFWQNSGDSQNNTGVMMYREPPAGSGNAPVINTDGTGVMNGAINLPGSGIVAGSWVTIKGANFSDVSANWNNLDFSNGLPTTLNGVQVMMNNQPAATYYIQSDQINVQAPSSVPSSGNISVQVVRNGVPSNTVNVNASATAPGIFPYSLDGKTFFPAAVFLDSTLVGDPAVLASTRKAKAGDVVLLFATGMGVSPAGVLVNPAGFSGDVKVLIDSTPAQVSSTFLVAPGEWQLNVTIPSGLSDGNHPIVIQTGGVSSQSGIVIPITH